MIAEAGDLGTLAVLNVGAGDLKLYFRPDAGEEERATAEETINDLIRRGYSILVELPDGGGYQRVERFDPATSSYIVAAPPIAAAAPEAQEGAIGAAADPPDDAAALRGKIAADSALVEKKRRRGRPPGATRSIPAASTRAVAVGRSAGG